MNMPVLQPIAILTKNQPWYRALYRWLFQIRRWRLVEDFDYEMSTGIWVRIIRGFEFDGASIPKIFWIVLSPTGLLLVPGLLHDFAYAEDMLLCAVDFSEEGEIGLGRIKDKMVVIPYIEGAGRKYWDKMFRDEAIHINGFRIINYVAWIAVRLFGWIPWNKYRKEGLIDVDYTKEL